MPSELGNQLGVISGVYLGTLLPWGFLYLHDFISERWQTIRRTCINGVLHLVFASLPLPYLFYYVFLQADLPEPDYKELFAAFSAAVFSVYHILRTLWGLYQLYRFREWAIETARIFESAGYITKRTFDVTKESGFQRLQMSRFTKTKQDPTIASPDPLLQAAGTDKGVMTQEPVCSTHDLGVTDAYRQKQAAKRDFRIRCEVSNMLVNSSVIDNEFINSYSPFRVDRALLKFRPLHKKGMYVTWAVVYLAQFGEQWLKECVGTDLANGTWEARRWNLAAQVWATAALRMEADCKAELSMKNVAGTDENYGEKSFLSPSDWNRVTDSVDDQLFSKEFVLRKIFSSGERLPYNYPIIDDFNAPLPSYRLYNPLIREAVASLPTRYYDIAENISGEHMEWFAVFLWISRWGGCTPLVNLCSSSSGSVVSATLSNKPTPEEAILTPSDTPVRVLQNQLGFVVPATLSRCAFPFLGRSYGRLLWTNRSVLQVSARIDNWIALSIGRQLKFAQSLDKALNPGSELFEKVHRAVEKGGSELETRDKELNRSSSIFGFHKLIETKRLRNQLANPQPLHRHLEIGLTFMGCVMENTRSGIAETINTVGEIIDWCPPIPDQAVSFKASVELCDCLKREMRSRPTRILINSTLQERVLWECQNGINNSWQKKLSHLSKAEFLERVAISQTVESMLLCMLGFPSIRVVCKGNVYLDQKFPSTVLVFEVEPVAGPQPIWIEIVVDCQLPKMHVKVCTKDSRAPLKFQWQDWRDAFEGRLLGKSEWQKAHYMRDVQIRKTSAMITAGIIRKTIGQDDGDRPVPDFRKYLVWDGWRPFRPGMPLFELRHSSLIIINYTLPTQSTQGADESTDTDIDGFERFDSEASPDAYNRASMSALTDASAHLDSLLALNTNLVQGTDSLTQNPEDDRPESQLVEFSPVFPAPSSSSEGPSFRLLANLDPPLPNKVLERVQEQDAIAMHILAKWVLRGSHGFKKNFSRAILLMERALVLARSVKTARLLVRSLLDKTFAPDGPIDVERALSAVELLWRDMVSRHEVVTVGKKRIRRWRGDADTEAHRMSQLVELNLMIVEVQPTADLMRDLAGHLSTWGESSGDDETAKMLYESAILADIDSKAMMELGRKYTRRHSRYAAALFERALKAGQIDAAKYLKDTILRNCNEFDTQEVRRVYEMTSQAGHVEAMRELGFWLQRKTNRGENDSLQNDFGDDAV